MSQQKKIIYLNIVIALLCLPIHYYMGEALKIAILPYVLFMLFSKNPNYFPALIIHTIPGNTVCLVILFGCIWLALINFNILKKYRVASIFSALIILLPVNLFFLYEGIFLKNMGFSLSLNYLGFYLSFFAFFYGILISAKINKNHWRAIILIVFLLPIIMYFPSPQKIVIRLFWLALPLAITILASGFFQSKLKLEVSLKIWSILFIIFIGIPYGLKFTPIFSAVLAITILLFYLKGYKLLFNGLTTPKVGVIIGILIVLLINNIMDSSLHQASYQVGQEIVDFDSFMSYLKFKTIDDRAVIWKGGWDFINNSSFYWPTGDVLSYSFYTVDGREIEDVEFGVHNLALELMRNYGMVIGFYLFSLYIIIITKLNVVFKYCTSSFLLVFSATLLGLGISESIVGQASLMPMFSFTFLGLIGICFGIGKLKTI